MEKRPARGLRPDDGQGAAAELAARQLRLSVLGIQLFAVVAMLAGCAAPLLGIGAQSGGCGWIYHFTALAAVPCHTLVGLALARSRLRLAIMAYEMRPGGN